MNGDAKSPQHTVVHPMYVSYTSIPTTSASATMQSNKHLQLQQQQQQNSLKLYHHQQQQQPNQPKLHHFNKNYQLSGSNNNTLDNNLHQPRDTTNNHSASFQPPHNQFSHLTQGSNCSSLRRQRHNHSHKIGQPPVSPSPMSPQTTPSLSYASLQNSNPYLAGGHSLSNSNYSIFQSPDSLQGSSHFARIHHKPKPPKSGLPVSAGGLDPSPGISSPVRPLERLSRNLEEDEDNFSLQQFAPGEHGVTYVPFQSPTPNSLFLGENNNVFQSTARSSPNNNSSSAYPYDQNGLPSPLRLGSNSKARRPAHIPLPTVPMHSCLEMQDDEDADGESELDLDQMLTPPPPPVVRPPPHIHQRLGQAPYLDLSPEVAERYAMPGPPLQGPLPVPHGSPMVRRSNRRPRPPIPVNFCDQIRAPPPGYAVVRAQSDDRLVEQAEAEAAPHVNRRSGRSANGQKSRPRSFCNSIVGVQA
ncbi:sodium/potassium-transporting ATPase subunit beta-1-interacting protein isoform X3 [Drosophila takahashii]